MFGPTPSAVDDLYQRAATTLGGAAATDTAHHVAQAGQVIHAMAQYGDTISLGLLPLAIVLLILHENYEASVGGRAFRVTALLVRVAVFTALTSPYGYGLICSLITGAAGGGSGWLKTSAIGDAVQHSIDGLGKGFEQAAGEDPGISDYARAILLILPLLGLWLFLMASIVCAYIAGLLLSLSQSVLLALLLAVGKTCLTVSIVPGIGLAGGWAKSLAKVAAWSTVASLITGLMFGVLSPDLTGIVANSQYRTMLWATAQFMVLAVLMFSVPSVTERIFSGAAAHGNGALEAIGGAFLGARMLNRLPGAVMGAINSKARSFRIETNPGAGGGTGGGPGGGKGGGSRPYKTSPTRLRQGFATAGAGGPPKSAARPTGPMTPTASPGGSRETPSLSRQTTTSAGSTSTARTSCSFLARRTPGPSSSRRP